MPARHEFADFCLELLRPLGPPRLRRMFGGHGIYVDDVFIAIIFSDELYLKTDATTRPVFAAAGGQPFVFERDGPTETSYWTVPAEAMESAALMHPWARRAMEAALRARAAKPASARRKPPATRPAAPATPRKAKAAAPRAKPVNAKR